MGKLATSPLRKRFLTKKKLIGKNGGNVVRHSQLSTNPAYPGVIKAGGHVAIIDYSSQLSAIVIDNPTIYNTFVAWFEMIWNTGNNVIK